MFKVKFKSVSFFLISFFSVVLQGTIAHSLSIYSIKPDFILLLVVFYSLYNGSKAAIFYGIVMGLCVDALSGGVMGLNSFTLGLVGGVCGLLKERVYINHFLTKFLVAVGAGVLNIAIYYCLALQFFKLPGFFSNMHIIIGTIIYSAVWNILVVEILDRIVIERSTALL